MITGVYCNGIRLFDDFEMSVDTLSASIVSLQGYNFDKLQGVLLSSTNNQIFQDLVSKTYTRQPSVSGIEIGYNSVRKKY